MKFTDAPYFRFPIILFLLLVVIATGSMHTEALAAKKDKYDIIYLLTKDLERALDYKAELETVFDEKVVKKLKVVGRGDEYALIYDGNDSASTVAHTLIKHAELLNKAGFDEPYATKEQNFYSLYNVSYGMGRNEEPLKKKYQQIYGCLGEEVKNNLFIEKTDYGNYALIYRYRGDKTSTTAIAKKHARILQAKKIKTSLTPENNNEVVYGESSLINDVGSGKPLVCTIPAVDTKKSLSEKPLPEKSLPEKIVATPKVVKDVPSRRLGMVSANFSKFEQSIEQYIDTLRKEGRISSDESTGWMVYDLEKNESVIDINADQEFQAASMIKPFVALAYFHQVNAGKLKYTSTSRQKLEAMIQRSNNAATNWVMRQVGGPAKCDAILKQYYGKIFKKAEIKEYIPAGGRTYLNSAPPSDYVRFLIALWNENLPQGKEIRRLMALPGRDRLYHGTTIPKGTLVYNKTGSTAHLIGDMGILVPRTTKGGQFPYAIVGIIERRSKAPNYGQWAHSRSRVIREVSTLVYEELKKEHHLR
ncbi:serine hydrolase [Desulfopila sp. IMCC35006]|uniref:serine hydrolase n=1 Tax=Desulfopila sp. IMCC35006 TaxID=2569542 RepID=UPI0010ABD3FA|nr:serine hydrolase [Desulfopila sp. IMCC35006]TKB25384.1 serine hydrolase [Desulfopila sp. IMCC35006]